MHESWVHDYIYNNEIFPHYLHYLQERLLLQRWGVMLAVKSTLNVLLQVILK